MTMEPDVCDACDGNGFFTIAHDGNEDHAWIERCDQCVLFGSDDEAAGVYAAKVGPVSYAWTTCDPPHLQPYAVGEERADYPAHPFQESDEGMPCEMCGKSRSVHAIR